MSKEVMTKEIAAMEIYLKHLIDNFQKAISEDKGKSGRCLEPEYFGAIQTAFMIQELYGKERLIDFLKILLQVAKDGSDIKKILN